MKIFNSQDFEEEEEEEIFHQRISSGSEKSVSEGS